MHLHPDSRPGLAPRALLVALLVMAIGLSACADTSSRALIGGSTLDDVTTTTEPGPGPTLPPPVAIPDTRAATIRPVAGRVKPVPIPVRGGTSSVTGTVTGPDGGVAGATVMIERFVGLQSGSILVAADGAGRFSATNVLGGRYRVRAWLQPSLTTVTANTGFVAEGDQISLPVTVERHDAVTLQVASVDSSMSIGVPAGVVALLTQQSVDADGIVRQNPIAGASLLLVGSAGLSIEAPNPEVTNAAGRVVWNVTCSAVGTYTVSVSSTAPPAVAGATLPECVVSSPTSSTSTTSTTIGDTTTTTKGPGGPGR